MQAMAALVAEDIAHPDAATQHVDQGTYAAALPSLVTPAPIRPEFYASDTKVTSASLQAMDIGIGLHHTPQTVSDRVALAIVKALRKPSDYFFSKRYVHRALLLETVAAVPGAVAGLRLHLRSLRRMDPASAAHDLSVISHLLHEAENERMHLNTWLEIARPNLFDRAMVWCVQKVFLAGYTALYAAAPQTAHRLVGYLEEEAVVSYTAFAAEIDAGRIENIPAPRIAIDYWNLEETARLKDVVLAVRADEAQHRDVNHHIANKA